MNARVQLAHDFARVAHEGQSRKYTDAPYYEDHLVPVAAIVSEVTDDPDMIAAAVLHDVLEDTGTKMDDLVRMFGSRVAHLVLMVTDVSTPEDGTRAARKAKDRDHLELACPDAKTIKLADIINNATDIAANDPEFSKFYLQEKLQQLGVLMEGNPVLYARAMKVVRDAIDGSAQA